MRVFVTGASGWIGSAVVPELLAAGHEVVGLARSEASAAALAAAGATVQQGSLDDLEVLSSAASASDGVIHLAFKHDLVFSGDPDRALDANRRAIETLGEALAGTGRPLVAASGVLGLAPGRVATERDGRDPEAAQGSGLGPARLAAEQRVLAFAAEGVRSSAVRISPTCHGEGDHGFMAVLVGIARSKG
ncbi:MAG: NAD-dependent epimerase/dehydratase family protein, partial [Acidimicrobiales bacterium]